VLDRVNKDIVPLSQLIGKNPHFATLEQLLEGGRRSLAVENHTHQLGRGVNQLFFLAFVHF
jgi:hypothetical protein